MRVFLVVLLVANLLVAALNYFAASSALRAKPPEELNAEQIRILGPAAEAAAPAPAAQSAAAAPPTPVPAQPSACLAWGVFNDERAHKAREALTALALGEGLSEQSMALASKYWVYLPAPADPDVDPDKRLSEVKKLKVGEAALVREEGKWRHAISFGLFNSQEAARKRQQDLVSKGVSGTKIEPRGEARKQTLFLVHDPNDQVTARITELSLQFPGSELRAIPCPQQPNGHG